MPSNRAAVLEKERSRMTVCEVPYPELETDRDIIIKTKAVAINPIDEILQANGTGLSFSWVKYPAIFGYDVAGEVLQVGSKVTRFKQGDRVVGVAYGLEKSQTHHASKSNYPRSAFQEYVLLSEHVTSPIPDHVTYESASGIPLAFITAAAALFAKSQLNLNRPSANPKPTGQTVLIWGGSTSVGCNAIQLAVNAGYEVFTTCSPKNFGLVKSLGASQVWDYNDPKAIQDIVTAFKGKNCVGAVSLGSGAVDKIFNILPHVEGRKHIAMGTFPLPDPMPKSFVLPRIAWHFGSWMVVANIRGAIRGIKFGLVASGATIEDGVGEDLFTNFLPLALQQGSFVPKPDPELIGHGLDNVQLAFDTISKGVSAKKLVVTV